MRSSEHDKLRIVSIWTVFDFNRIKISSALIFRFEFYLNIPVQYIDVKIKATMPDNVPFEFVPLQITVVLGQKKYGIFLAIKNGIDS